MSTEQDSRVKYDAVVAELTASSPTKAGKMFGMPCLKNENGKAFAGFTEGAMVFKLKLGSPQHTQALALSGAHLFDPMGGRPMKEWVEVSVEHVDQWLGLAQEAMGYVGGGG